MTNQTNRKEENVINSCILRSKDIVTLSAARIRNRHTSFLTKRALRSLRSNGYCKNIEEEIDQIIDDHKLSIGMLLRPIFLLNKIPLKVDKDGRERFWFSSHDLTNGYVILYSLIRKDTATHVLFLSDWKGFPFDDIKSIKAGEIHPYQKVAPILKEIQPAWKDQALIRVINQTK